MPFSGPVAYQYQSLRLTFAVRSIGLAQVLPSSLLCVTKARRVSLETPRVIVFSVSLPRFQVIQSQMTPVLSSTTGAGLPQVFSPSDQRNCCCDQVLPPSVDRFSSK